MSEQVYTWKRFWVPRTGEFHFTDDGYLLDPESELWKWRKSDIISFSALAHYPCLALLGEPGMGKSFALREACASLEPSLRAAGDVVEYIDLRAFGSEDRLVNRVFQSQELKQWLVGSYTLHLFLDSLDECLLRIDTFSAILLEELRGLPLNRLTIRIACRTADWPQSLETGLRTLFGPEEVGVFELAPLRKPDVAQAAEGQALKADQFLEAIRNSRVVALAIRPVTLNFLMDTFRSRGSLPPSQTQLYLDGCRLLCEETNHARRESRRVGDLSADERLMAAARMAAVTVFGNKYAIWAGIQSGVVQPEDVTLRSMAGGTELWGGCNKLLVSEKTLREAISTALFTSRGGQRFGWAHQTYAEFLAALYILRKGLTVTQVMSLLRHPDDPTGKLVPQLHEVAAWLAAQSPEIWQQIMRSDPEVLLRSDAANVAEADRASLVESFLKSVAEGRLVVPSHLRGLYSRFGYTGLAEHLNRWISDRGVDVIARHTAIDIAEACRTNELQSVLADIALDSTEDIYLRVNAAYAVVEIADEPTRARLRLLVLGGAGEDPDDELKGCGLLATWPGHLSAKELFTHLTAPKRESLIGVYTGIFLTRDLAADLKPSDLPDALEWVSSLDAHGQTAERFHELATAILLKAVRYLGAPSLTSPLGRAVTAYLKRHHDLPTLIHDELSHYPDGRKQLVEELVSGTLDGWAIAHSRLVLEGDLEFIISKIESICAERLRWVEVLRYVVNPQDQEHLARVYVASQTVPELTDAFAWFLSPVDLDSARAVTMRQQYEERQTWERPQDRPKLTPSPAQRIAALLDRFETGDLNAWWILNREMTLQDDSTHYGDELESDLTALPGWLNSTGDIRQRILSAAEQYLLQKEPNTKKWWGTDTFHFPDFSAYRALLLLDHEKPVALERLSGSVWKKWVPVIFSYPISTGTGREGPHVSLATMAYRHVPEDCVDCLNSILIRENERHSHVFTHRRLGDLWESLIADTFLERVMDPGMRPTCMADLLDLLLDHDVEAARAYAVSLVRNRTDSGRALWAGISLANHTLDAAWSVVWPAVCVDPDFGREFCMTVASTHESSVLQRLSEPQLRDLYLWLVEQFPYQDDPRHEDVHWVGPRESVANWRDAALRTLQHRATGPAVQALEEIVERLPDYTWIKRILLESREMYRRASWTPAGPSEILSLTADNKARLVRGGDDLLHVVIESLGRLQIMLQGETPAAIDLWNTATDDSNQPKDENEFSNYVKRHLESDLFRSGIIVNREVEIRRGYQSGSGERTDLLIHAVIPGSSPDSTNAVSLMVEVKGSWHRELNTAMKEQLRDRYLRDSRCRHGLYLVGWFPRAKATRDISSRDELADIRKRLESQAEKLSSDDVRVAAYVLDCSLR